MSRYTVYIFPDLYKKLKKLPGNVRHRIKRVIDQFAQDPRPPKSKTLETTHILQTDLEIRRCRLENWRIIYAVNDAEKTVDVIAVRKRPPYDYGDLADLIEKLFS